MKQVYGTFGVYRRSGFTMIEVLVAMFVLSVGLLGLVMMSVVVLQVTRYDTALGQARDIGLEAMNLLSDEDIESYTLNSIVACPQVPPKDGNRGCFFSGDGIPAADCPPDHNNGSFPANCPGPADWAGARMIWIDGDIRNPPINPLQSATQPMPYGTYMIRSFKASASKFLVYYNVVRDCVQDLDGAGVPVGMELDVDDCPWGNVLARKTIRVHVIFYDGRRHRKVSIERRTSNQ